MVLSPASVPSCSRRVEFVDGLGDGTGAAGFGDQQQGESRPTDRDRIVSQDPSQPFVAREGQAWAEVLGRRVDVRTFVGDLHKSKFSDITTDGGLGDIDAVPGEQFHELVLTMDRAAIDEMKDAPLTLQFRAPRGAWSAAAWHGLVADVQLIGGVH